MRQTGRRLPAHSGNWWPVFVLLAAVMLMASMPAAAQDSGRGERIVSPSALFLNIEIVSAPANATQGSPVTIVAQFYENVWVWDFFPFVGHYEWQLTTGDMTLYHRVEGAGSWDTIPMSYNGGSQSYSATIPGSQVYTSNIYYGVRGTKSGHLPEYEPNVWDGIGDLFNGNQIPVIQNHTVTFVANANGSITGTLVQTVAHNGSTTPVSPDPDTGYHFLNWTGDYSGTDDPLTINNVTSDMTVYANFEINEYTVTFIEGANGTISGTLVQSVTHGGSTTPVDPEGNTGYHFLNWTGDYSGTDDPLTISGVTSDMTVTANFEINEYTVTFVEGANGSITGTLVQTVTHGSSTSPVSPDPDTGYHFLNWTGDYSGIDDPLTISGVTSDMTVTANFEINEYTVNFYAGPNGSLSGVTSQTVTHGSDATPVEAIPDTHYYFVDWTGDRNSGSNPFTVTGVTSDIDVTANFEAIEGNLTVYLDSDFPGGAPANGGWAIEGNNVQQAAPSVVWHNSGDTVTLLQGTYTIIFRDIYADFGDPFDTPASHEIEIAPDGAQIESEGAGTASIEAEHEYTGTYLRHRGSLQVNLNNQFGETMDIATWGHNDPAPAPTPSAAGYASGFTATGLPTGDYTLSFTAQPDHDSPVPAAPVVTVSKDDTTVYDALYDAHTGGIQGFARRADNFDTLSGATWNIVGDDVILNANGPILGNLKVGTYMVEFSDLPDFTTPAPVPVTVTNGAVSQAVGLYSVSPGVQGSLQIRIEDQLARQGGQWAIVNPDFVSPSLVWYDSGVVVSGLRAQDYQIKFRTVDGYVLPDLQGVSVEPDIVTHRTGEYVRPYIVGYSDYDGNGTDDLASWSKESRRWIVVGANGNAAVAGPRDIINRKYGPKHAIPTPGDYDGDAIADLSYYDNRNGDWAIRGEPKAERVRFDDPTEGDLPVPGDYNGDGMTNRAIYRPETGEWMIHDLNGDGKIAIIEFGGPGMVPVPGNFDGDVNGTTDLAIYNVENGKWKVLVATLQNDNTIKFKKKAKYNAKLGNTGDIPIAADLTGDGKANHIVYDPTTSTFYWIDPEEDDVQELQVGEPGDLPAVNDWAGLGRSVPAVFRLANGRWISINGQLGSNGGQPLANGRR